MEFIYDYFERLVFLFEEENDVLDIRGKIKKEFNFISAAPHLNKTLEKLEINTGYLTDNNQMFCIRLKDNSGKNYFYDFYVDSPLSSPSTKLVFGINTIYDDGKYLTLNGLSDDQIWHIKLKDIIGNHDAAKKISVPPEITDNFFSAILKYSLDFGMFSKKVSFRGHLEADEIPFTNLTYKYATESIKNKKEIFKYLNDLSKYVNSIILSINKNITKIDNYSSIDDLIKKMKKIGKDLKLDMNHFALIKGDNDPILKEYFLNFNNIHSSINVSYGRGGSSLEGLVSKFLGKKLNNLINFFSDLEEKVIYLRDQLDKIPDEDFNFKTFSAKVDKLRNSLFHRNKLYRIFINKFFRINEFVGKEDIIPTEETIKNKKTIFDHIIKSLKNKKIETTIKIYNANTKKFEDKSFTYNLYSQALEDKIKNFFNSIKDESIFNDENIDQTTKLIKKEIDEYLLDNMISMDKGWVTFNIVN